MVGIDISTELWWHPFGHKTYRVDLNPDPGFLQYKIVLADPGLASLTNSGDEPVPEAEMFNRSWQVLVTCHHHRQSFTWIRSQLL